MSTVSTARDGEVLVVTIDNPPLNTLGTPTRQALAAAIEEASGDAGVKAVVICSEGRAFCAGADITEFGKVMPEPLLPALLDSVEACSKPTVAAIHATCLGGGLELALACNYRVATSSAKLGLPEIKLGLLPGAGGTQRLPRVAGIANALEVIVGGNPVGGDTAAAMGIVDRVLPEDGFRDAAVAFAREVAGKAEHPVSSRRTDALQASSTDVFDEYRQKNARKLRGLVAPAACMEAIGAALTLPYEEGVKVERKLFMELMQGTQSAALRHAFFAERMASKIDGVGKDTDILPIRKVGIIGAGTMGGGIAMNFLSAGYDVTIVERAQDALDRGTGIIRKNYDASAAKGRMSAEQVETAMGYLATSLSYDDLADCDLVIEAAFEDMGVKKEVFGKLDAICRPDAIMATNTSYLDVNEIAASTSRPEMVVGLHFFSPANIMKLLEIVRGDKTAPRVLATAMDLAKKIRKVAVVAGVCFGFIGNRMLAVRQKEAQSLLMEGATPQQVDQVLTDFGLPMGPFQMADLAGLDLGWNAETSSSSTVREVLCEMGRRGQKTGKGFYDYDDKRRGSPSDEVAQVIADFAAKSGKEQRDISDEEIRARLLYPMVNEGAKILEEGIAQRASDIDIVYIYGYGWPAYTGGPMFWADTVSLGEVVAGLERYADHMTDLEISALLKDKAAKGETFNG